MQTYGNRQCFQKNFKNNNRLSALGIVPALKTGPRGLLYEGSHLVEVSPHLTAAHLHHLLPRRLLLSAPAAEEQRSQRGDGVGRGPLNLHGGVHRAHLDGALVARAAEAVDGLLVAPWDGRRAGLLQADNVRAEAEAEVTRVLARDLNVEKRKM